MPLIFRPLYYDYANYKALHTYDEHLNDCTRSDAVPVLARTVWGSGMRLAKYEALGYSKTVFLPP